MQDSVLSPERRRETNNFHKFLVNVQALAEQHRWDSLPERPRNVILSVDLPCQRHGCRDVPLRRQVHSHNADRSRVSGVHVEQRPIGDEAVTVTRLDGTLDAEFAPQARESHLPFTAQRLSDPLRARAGRLVRRCGRAGGEGDCHRTTRSGVLSAVEAGHSRDALKRVPDQDRDARAGAWSAGELHHPTRAQRARSEGDDGSQVGNAGGSIR